MLEVVKHILKTKSLVTAATAPCRGCWEQRTCTHGRRDPAACPPAVRLSPRPWETTARSAEGSQLFESSAPQPALAPSAELRQQESRYLGRKKPDGGVRVRRCQETEPTAALRGSHDSGPCGGLWRRSRRRGCVDRGGVRRCRVCRVSL